MTYSSMRYFCTKVNKTITYSKTVILPSTKFPLRLENKKICERDKTLNKMPAFADLYEWQSKTLSTPEFILHDGPPYANGSPHMGHALNKILKDIIVRSHIINGRKVQYIPGWDCHGLPIELKALKNNKKDLSVISIREKARNFASDTIELQENCFKSWGVAADWKNSYKTFDKTYVKNLITQFYELYEKNLVYRDLKPVYWSPSSRTALAEAELEYNDKHKSMAVTLKLKVKDAPDTLKPYLQKLFAIIWTTTPWTLPSNQCISYNPKILYSLVCSAEKEYYIVATDLVESLSKICKRNLETLHVFEGENLYGIIYEHPIYKNIEAPLLPSSHATATKGSGLVHTAPAHGPEDFLVALNNKLPIKCIVDEDGCYSNDAGPLLTGLDVLTEGNKKVLEIIYDKVLHKEEYIHSYPYDWRSKKPVILRASQQWFLDTDAIKTLCLEALNKVEIVPKIHEEKHRKLLIDQIKKRPYWCISRQRCWGVPIPVFYDSTGQPVINKKLIEHYCNLIDQHGTDFWWSLPTEKNLDPEITTSFNLPMDKLQQGKDILDIWFDSGMSWSSALSGEKVADLYLEGVDQCTGWFQTSLLTSIALRRRAPYKTLYVHGFVVDEKGLKMSKSVGNVIDPADITIGTKGKKPFGVDVLRWWVAYHANQDALTHISENILKSSADDIQKIRSIIRFALGALKDFDSENLKHSDQDLIDKYLLHKLYLFNKKVTEYYDAYQFHKICILVLNFLTNTVSALYYTAIKDRLYCNLENNKTRRSSQSTLNYMFYIVTKSIAPIVPHLAEEMYEHLPNKDSGSFFQYYPEVCIEIWKNDAVESLMEEVLNIKKAIHKELGATTANAHIELKCSNDIFKKLQDETKEDHTIEDQLCDIFQVSTLKLMENHMLSTKFELDIKRSNLTQCLRCRKISSEKNNELCLRCKEVLYQQTDKNIKFNL